MYACVSDDSSNLRQQTQSSVLSLEMLLTTGLVPPFFHYDKSPTIPHLSCLPCVIGRLLGDHFSFGLVYRVAQFCFWVD